MRDLPPKHSPVPIFLYSIYNIGFIKSTNFLWILHTYSQFVGNLLFSSEESLFFGLELVSNAVILTT